MGLTVRLQSVQNSLPAAFQRGFIAITVTIRAFAHWGKNSVLGQPFDQVHAHHGWLHRS